MTKYILAIATVFVLFVGGMCAKEANAQGFHFGGAGVHVDVGYPHGGGGYGGYGSYPQSTYWGGGWSGYGGHSWHDTTHLDYHPGRYERHYDHFHYERGHYDVHSNGHLHHDHF